MRTLDLSSWHGILTSLLGLALFALIGVGIRVLLTMTIQQRRERANRQINERLKTLMAAYKALGGSFTGNLTVDPTHLRELRQRSALQAGDRSGGGGPDAHPLSSQTGSVPSPAPAAATVEAVDLGSGTGSDRARRIRDSVEASLSDILLLGTEEQVRLAAKAVSEMVEGRPIHTAELVISLRDFIRKALDLAPIPSDVRIPLQGPTRPASGSGGNRSGAGEKSNGRGGAGGGGSGSRGSAGLEGGFSGGGSSGGIAVKLHSADEEGDHRNAAH